MIKTGRRGCLSRSARTRRRRIGHSSSLAAIKPHLDPHPSSSKLVDKTHASEQVQNYFKSTANTGGHPIDIKTPEDVLLRSRPSQCWQEDNVFSLW